MTFFTSSMSCHTSERLARALVLTILTMLIVGLVSASTGEEVEAPSGAASALATTSLGSTTGVGPELISWCGRGVEDLAWCGSTEDRTHNRRRSQGPGRRNGGVKVLVGEVDTKNGGVKVSVGEVGVMDGGVEDLVRFGRGQISRSPVTEHGPSWRWSV
jgi:hypothetical protein